MKHWVLAILLAAMWGTVAAIMFTPGVADDHGQPHPEFSAMDQGGDGLHRHRQVFLPGCLFGGVMIAMFVGLLYWGLEGSTSPARIGAFVLGGLLYEGVFAMMCLTYWRSLTAEDVAFWGPFPASLSWLLFGVWGIPSFFIVLYVLCFPRWILPPHSKRRFRELVEASGKHIERDSLEHESQKS